MQVALPLRVRNLPFRDRATPHSCLGLPSRPVYRGNSQFRWCSRLQPALAVASENKTSAETRKPLVASDSAGAKHASNPSDFSVTASQLQALVQEAFSEGGFSRDASLLAAQLCSSTQTGLDGSPSGPPDAAFRIRLFGANQLAEQRPVSFWALVREALEDRTLQLLIAAGAISFALAAAIPDGDSSDWIEGVAILTSVMIVVFVGSITNYQKETKFRVLNALKDDIQVRVVRGAVERPISTQELLVGDLLIVETGDILPADGILVAGEELRLDESHMTGEAEEVMKSVSNGSVLMLAGSKVREGYGRMLVLAVGARSQQGLLQAMVMLGAGKSHQSLDEGDGPAESTGTGTKRAPMASAAQEETLLTRKLQGLADLIGNAGLAAAAFVTTISALEYTATHLLGSGGVPVMEAVQAYLGFFITGVTILVVAVPEGLPLAVTLALAFSVQRMLKDNNLVRHLDACETMASATTICSDKTGTLTANEMVVTRAWAGGKMFNVAPASVPNPVASNGASEAPATAPSGVPAGLAAVGSPAALAFMGSGEGEVAIPLNDVPCETGEACGYDPMDLPNSLPQQLSTLMRQGVKWNCTASLRTDTVTGTVEKIGNRTECALLEWANGAGPAEQDGPVLLQSIPFTSERKRMSALVVVPEVLERLRQRTHVPCRVLIKGAAEVVMDRCVGQLGPDGHVVPLAASAKRQLLEPFTRQGLRVLALAQREISLPSHVLAWPEGPEGRPIAAPGLQMMPVDILEDKLVLVGLLGLQDPLRPDVPQAIQQCQRAGIVVRMLTGDNARTAASIASECGILPCPTDIDHSLEASSKMVNTLLEQRRRSLSPPGSETSKGASNGNGHENGRGNGNGNGNGHKNVIGNGSSDLQGSFDAGTLAAQQDSSYQALKTAAAEEVLPLELQQQNALRKSQWAGSAYGNAGSGDSLDSKKKPGRPLNSLDDDASGDEAFTAAASRSYDNGDAWGAPEQQRNEQKPADNVQKPPPGTIPPSGDRAGAWSAAIIAAAAGQPPAIAAPAGDAATTAHDPYSASVQAALAAVQGLQPYQVPPPVLPGADNPVQGVASAVQGLGSAVQGSSSEPNPVQGAPTSSAPSDPPVSEPNAVQGARTSSPPSERSHAAALSIDLVDPRELSEDAIASGQLTPPRPVVELEVLAAAIVGAELTSMTSAMASTEMSSQDEGDPPLPPNMTLPPAVVLDVPPSEAPGTGPVAAAGLAAWSGDWSFASGRSGDAESGFLEAQASGPPLVLEGPQFRELVQLEDGTLDLKALRIIWPRLRVIARCSPADKYLLVTGLKLLRQQTQAQEGGQGHLHEVVAMTGDGTNDAPALSAADVGFAMNSGTSIAKDAADILLMDNSFSSIVSAVKWGRNVYASVTKFLQFQLTANVVAVVTAGSGALLTAHSPLSAVQMLWVNLLMDSLASLALATEAPTEELLDLPPVPPDQPLITPVVAKHILGQAVVQLVMLASLVAHGQEWFHVNSATNDTLIFNTFVCMQLFNQFNCRKVLDEKDIMTGLLSHPTFCAIVAAEAALQVAIVQFGGAAFQTRPLDASQWAACIGLGATTLLVRAALRRVPAGPLEKLFAKGT